MCPSPSYAVGAGEEQVVGAQEHQVCGVGGVEGQHYQQRPQRGVASWVFILPHDSLLSILFCSMILLYDMVMLFKLGLSYWSSHCVVTWYH